MLLTFYDFPAEHWKHLRTTNPIESSFATVRLRTIKTKGCLSRTTALTMVFKLCQSAAKKWRGLDGSHRLAEIVEGVKFKDGEKLTKDLPRRRLRARGTRSALPVRRQAVSSRRSAPRPCT